MVKISQHSFLGGQMDRALVGRQDLETYSRGADRLVNFLPKRHGSIAKRPGTDFVTDVTAYVGDAGTYRRRLVEFAYAPSQGFVLLFAEDAGGGKARALSVGADGSVTSVEVVAEGTAHLSGAQIEEFDWCQSGDVMYIAHRGHEPCRIEHRVAGGTHSFRLLPMDFRRQEEGRPEIAGASVTKLKVANGGGLVTEYYKATAVYGGVETLPGGEYFGVGASDSEDLDDYLKCDQFVPVRTTQEDSTSYHAPWTESQVIKLRIPIPSRAKADGSGTEEPEQVRVYKKSGGTYGLIGTVSKGDYAETSGISVGSGYYARFASSTPGGDAEAKGLSARDARAWGAGSWAAYRMQGKGEDAVVEAVLEEPCDEVSLTVHMGGITYAVEEMDAADWGGRKRKRCTLTYHALGVGYLQARLMKASARDGAGGWPVSGAAGHIGYTGPSADESSANYVEGCDAATGNVTRTVEQEASGGALEGEAEFEARWRAALERLCADLAAAGVTEGVVRTIKTSDSSASTVLQLRGRTGGAAAAPFWLSNVHAELPGESAEIDRDRYFYFRDNNIAPDMSVTPPTAFGGMGGEGDWPGCVCIHEQRLAWASTENEPARVMMSQVGDFGTYSPHDELVPDDPIDFEVAATRFPKVRHMVELRKLVLFNGDSEWIVDSASASSPLTWETVRASRHSGIGAAAGLKPVVCNNVLLFAEATGRAVRAYSYRLEDDGFGGEDVSIMSQSIFREHGGITSWAYQQHPDGVLWCCLEDGAMASLTFNREHRTMAWAVHRLGGGGKARAAAATSALAGGSGARETEVFLLVERAGRWTLERMRTEGALRTAAVAEAACLDSARRVAAGAACPAGMAAVDLATGAETADAAGERICGYAFASEYRSARPVLPERMGGGQFSVRCAQFAHLRIARGAGGKVWAEGVPEEFATALGGAEPEVSGGTVSLPVHDESAELVADNNRDGRINVKQDGPWPFEIALVETDLELEEEGRRER